VNHSYPCLDFSRRGTKREERKWAVVRAKEQTCKKLSKRARGAKKRGGWKERKLVGDENESRKEGKEYSCSLYLVSYEFEVLELKVKAIFRIQ